MLVSLHNWEIIPGYLLNLIGAKSLVFNVIIHEGFHIFRQDRAILTGETPWPNWGNFVHHGVVEEKCYHNPLVLKLYEKEFRTLTRSMHLMFLTNDVV